MRITTTKQPPRQPTKLERDQDLIGKTIIGIISALALVLLLLGIGLVSGAFPGQADHPREAGVLLIVFCLIVLGYMAYKWKVP